MTNVSMATDTSMRSGMTLSMQTIRKWQRESATNANYVMQHHGRCTDAVIALDREGVFALYKCYKDFGLWFPFVTRVILRQHPTDVTMEPLVHELWQNLLPSVKELIISDYGCAVWTAWPSYWRHLKSINVKYCLGPRAFCGTMEMVERCTGLRSLLFDTTHDADACLTSTYRASQMVKVTKRFATTTTCCESMCITLCCVPNQLQRATDPDRLFAHTSHTNFQATLLFWQLWIQAVLANPHLLSLHINVPAELTERMTSVIIRRALEESLQKALKLHTLSKLHVVYLHFIVDISERVGPQDKACLCAQVSDAQRCTCNGKKPSELLWHRRYALEHHEPEIDEKHTCVCNMCQPRWLRECTPLFTCVVPAWMRANARHPFRDSIAQPELITTIVQLIGSETSLEAMLSCTNVQPLHIHTVDTCGNDPDWNRLIADVPRLVSRWLSSRFVCSYTTARTFSSAP